MFSRKLGDVKPGILIESDGPYGGVSPDLRNVHVIAAAYVVISEVDGEHSIVPQQNLINVSLKDLEGARRTEIEAKKTKEDKKRQRNKKKEDLPGAILQVHP